MNTMDKVKENELKKLEQQKKKLSIYYFCSFAALIAFFVWSVFHEFSQKIEGGHFVLIAGAFILAFTAFYVSLFKYHKASDDVIAMKKELGILTEKDLSCRFYSTSQPTWYEKVGKIIGFAMIVLSLVVIALGTWGNDGVLPFGLPKFFGENYGLIASLMALCGPTIANYRPDLSQFARVSIWATVILVLATLLLSLMEHEIATWVWLLVMLLALISLLRTEKDVHFLNQEELDG